MGTTTVAFRKCVIHAQSPESGADFVTSRIFFDLEVGGERYANVYVDVQQSVRGGSDREPLIISDLHGYDGPLNVEVFRGSVEFYYRQALGGGHSLFTVQGKSLSLADWTIEQEMLVQFEHPVF